MTMGAGVKACVAAAVFASCAVCAVGGGVTFDFKAASDRLFRSEGGAGNLLNLDPKAWRPYGKLHVERPQPGIDEGVRACQSVRFDGQEGEIRTMPSVRDFFREKGIAARHVDSVSVSLIQQVRLPDDKGGRYRFTMQYQCKREGGLMSGLFPIPYDSRVPNDISVNRRRDMRYGVENDTDTEWFSASRTLLVPPGCDSIDFDLRSYSVGFLRFKDLSLVKLSDGPNVTLASASFGYVEDSFAIGEGQVGYPTWWWCRRPDFQPLRATATRFRMQVPAGFEFVSANFASPRTVVRERQADGSTLVTFVPCGNRSDVPRPEWNYRLMMGALIRATGAVGTEGWCTLQVVTANGEPYTDVVRRRLFVVPAVKAAAVPKRYKNGCLPILNPFTERDGDLDFAKTLYDAGVRWVVAGSLNDKYWIGVWRKAGIPTITPSNWNLYDGFRIGPSAGRPEGDRYKAVRRVLYENTLACPSAVYEERPFFMTNTVPWIRATFSGTDGVWSNWEPYKYFGMNACMCDTCRRKFAEFVGVSEEEMKKDWPHELAAGGKWSARIAAFRSREHGRLVRTVDKYVREATGGEKSYGFMPGISWGQISSTWRERADSLEVCHVDYAGSLKWLEPWGPYPRWRFSSPYVDRDSGKVAEYFYSARDARAQIDREFPEGSRPKLLAFPQGYQGDGITQPEWIAMALDSYFFNRWEGATLYHFPQGYDARYWRAFAEATERAARYEEFVWDGVRVDDKVRLEVDPADDLRIDRVSGFLGLRNASAIPYAAYELGGRTIVAVMNFRKKKDVRFTVEGRGSFVAPAARTTVLEFDGLGR